MLATKEEVQKAERALCALKKSASPEFKSCSASYQQCGCENMI